jgi:orotate phosphoribosyltransferase
MNKTPREELLTLLAQKSFQLGDFKLSSGGTSDYYIDCRTTTLDGDGARLAGRVFLDEIFRHGWEPQAIGGLTLGADPIVVAAAMLSAQQTRSRAPRPDTTPGGADYHLIHGFLVRKSEKAHGTARRIEGFQEKGAKVVIVDDVCTTGSSTVQAIEASREAGFDVIGVLCLVEREEAGGRASVEAAAAPAKFYSIFTADDVRQEHLKTAATNTTTMVQ